MMATHSVLLFLALAGAATCELVRKNIFVGDLFSWSDAQNYCRTYYEDMSTINTPWDFLKFKKDAAQHLSNRCWIGLNKKSGAMVYTEWSDGSPLGLPSWGLGEPNINRNFDCVTIQYMEMATFNCDQQRNFFCYKWVPRMVLVEMMMTWEEALQYCRTHYTDLVSVVTDKDLQVAKSTSMTSQTPRVWTGLRFMNGLWFWVNQDTLGNMTSVPSCPIRPLHCGALNVGDNILENRDCNEKMNFACY